MFETCKLSVVLLSALACFHSHVSAQDVTPTALQSQVSVQRSASAPLVRYPHLVLTSEEIATTGSLRSIAPAPSSRFNAKGKANRRTNSRVKPSDLDTLEDLSL